MFHQGRRFAAVLSAKSRVLWPIQFGFGKTAQHAPHPFGGRLASQAFAPMVSTMGLAPCEPIHPAKRRGARCLGETSGLSARIRQGLFSVARTSCHPAPATKKTRRTSNELEFGDFMQVGTVGLLEAINRFNPERGVRFETYAGRRIEGAILSGVQSLSERQQQVSARCGKL
jgi:hypothetical protein